MNVGVERRSTIGDVTVHEDLARRETDDLVGRYVAMRSQIGDNFPTSEGKSAVADFSCQFATAPRVRRPKIAATRVLAGASELPRSR